MATLLEILDLFLFVGGWLVAGFAFIKAFEAEDRAASADRTVEALSGNIDQWAALDAERSQLIRELSRENAQMKGGRSNTGNRK